MAPEIRAGQVYQAQDVGGTAELVELKLEVGRFYRLALWHDGKRTLFVESPEAEQLIADARLWWEDRQGRLFWCDQCCYFASSALAVQEHSTREHDCRFEVYYTAEADGSQVARVNTIKCHPRLTIRRRKPGDGGPWGA